MKRRKFIELSSIGAFVASWFKPNDSLGECWQPCNTVKFKGVWGTYKSAVLIVEDPRNGNYLIGKEAFSDLSSKRMSYDRQF